MKIDNDLYYLVSTFPEEEIVETLSSLERSENKQKQLDLGLSSKYTIEEIEKILKEELVNRKQNKKVEKLPKESFFEFVDDFIKKK